MRYMVAADTGGTFTDVAVYDAVTQSVSYSKTLTDYTHLVDGVLDGLSGTEVALSESLLFKHGTTHVINTFLQRSGGVAALITTEGFKDILEIARGNRPVPFKQDYRRDPPLIPRSHRFEVAERINHKGEVLEALNEQALHDLAQELKRLGVESVAISFMNAYANPCHEELACVRLKAWLPGVYVTCATTLTREWYEYERTSTAAANAYVGARIESYLRTFNERLLAKGFKGSFYMMGSNGGVLSVERAMEQPVNLVESGPIGGCIGAAAYAKLLGIDRLIAFDMGGTTAKCALVQNGQFDVHPIYYVGGYERGFPLKTPVLDIVEVGAGGGSIAAVDGFGRISVGPKSAGSEPGPVAFGRGGREPTVTDANVVLGRIGSGNFMKGKLRLDIPAAKAAVTELIAKPLGYTGDLAAEKASQGILDIATVTMAGAIKEITIERGIDARDFKLFVFGGGGPLFGSVLARALGIRHVVVPPHPGNFSTLGMLIAGARMDLARTFLTMATSDAQAHINRIFAELETEGRAGLQRDLGERAIDFEYSLEARYLGQTHTVRVAYDKDKDIEVFLGDFEQTYQKRFGHANADCEVEVLALKLGATAEIPKPDLLQCVQLPVGLPPTHKEVRNVYFAQPHGWLSVPVWQRELLPAGFAIAGPAIIEEFSSTTVLMPGDKAQVGAYGEINLEVCDV